MSVSDYYCTRASEVGTPVESIRRGSITPNSLSDLLRRGADKATMADRPTIRRKSSAQNLLSNFTSRPSNISPSALTSMPMSPPLPPLPDLDGPAQPDDTSIEYLRDLVQKRIITLTYMRNMHEGCVYSLHLKLVTNSLVAIAIGSTPYTFPNPT